MTISVLGQVFQVSSVSTTVDTECRLNIKKRHERLVYRTVTNQDHINIAYALGQESIPSNNLFISDRSTSISQNRIPLATDIQEDTVGQIVLSVEDFLATDVFTTDTATQEETALFYIHTLKNFNEDNDNFDNKSLLSIGFTDHNLEVINLTEYYLDSSTGEVYNNIENTYDDKTGIFNVTYVQYSVEETVDSTTTVTVYHELLNNKKVYQQASFEDLDEWGHLDTSVKKYLIDESIDGNEFAITLPTTTTYSWKETPESRLKLIEPAALSLENPWNLRVSNGKFIVSQLSDVNVYANYKYYIAEFNAQSYNPFPPYKFVSNQRAVWLSKSLIKVPKGVVEESGIALYLDVFVRDTEGTLVAVYTNDSSKSEVVYGEGVEYEYLVTSVDEKNGFIEINAEIDSSYTVTVNYYLEEKEYDITSVDFNPVNNRNILRQKVVFYISPETPATGDLDKTLYYLIVDPIGKITYCSQADENSSGLDPATQRLITEDFNTDGIPIHDFYYDIESSDEGLQARVSGVYADYLDELSFIDKYTIESVLLDQNITDSGTISSGLLLNYQDNSRFLVLGDVYVGSNQGPKGMMLSDVRIRGGGIKEDYESLSLAQQAEVTWYWDLNMNKPYPGVGAFYVEVPKSLHVDFGGEYTDNQIRTVIEKHMKAGGYAVVKKYGMDPVIIDTVSASGSIGFTWPSYGPGQQYNAYMSTNNSSFTLVSGFPRTDNGAENSVTLAGLRLQTKYYVYVAAINDDGYDEAGPIVAITTTAYDL